jgi:hypothetical protein
MNPVGDYLNNVGDYGHKQRLASFDCITGVTRGGDMLIDPDVLEAVTEWVVTEGGKARFYRVRDRRGNYRLVLSASVPGSAS